MGDTPGIGGVMDWEDLRHDLDKWIWRVRNEARMEHDSKYMDDDTYEDVLHYCDRIYKFEEHWFENLVEIHLDDIERMAR